MNIIKKGKLGNQYFIIEITNSYKWINPKYEINKKEIKQNDIIINVKNRHGMIKETFVINRNDLQKFL